MAEHVSIPVTFKNGSVYVNGKLIGTLASPLVLADERPEDHFDTMMAEPITLPPELPALLTEHFGK